MHKKSQVTVFIIIGIIVILIAGAFLMIREKTAVTKTNEEISIDTSSLNGFIASCAKQTAQDAVVYTGLRGGVNSPADSEAIYFAGILVPYYFFEGKEIAISADSAKKTLEYYMDNSIKTCTNSFESFKQQGYTIEEGDVTSTATIAEEEVIFDINYPVTLVKGGSRETKSAFSANVNVNLPKMMKAAADYITVQKGNPNAFRVGNLMDIASKEGLKFEAFDRDNGNVVISLVDESMMINKNPFVFTFAVKYSWTETEETVATI